VDGIVLRPGETGRGYLFAAVTPVAVPPPVTPPVVAVSGTTQGLVSAALLLVGGGGPAVTLPVLPSALSSGLSAPPGTPAGPVTGPPPAATLTTLSGGGGGAAPTHEGTAPTVGPVVVTPEGRTGLGDTSRSSRGQEQRRDRDLPQLVPPRDTSRLRERLADAFGGERLDETAGGDDVPGPEEDAVAWALDRRDDRRRAALDEPEDDMDELILYWIVLTMLTVSAPAR
jgi:hypothetical protein